MTEYHCEFCGATGTELRNEKKGCCNNCGAPIGITKKEADKILEKLYEKQTEFKAYIYSPFVETELAKLEKDKKSYQKSIDYLLESLKNTRKIKTDI